MIIFFSIKMGKICFSSHLCFLQYKFYASGRVNQVGRLTYRFAFYYIATYFIIYVFSPQPVLVLPKSEALFCPIPSK